MLGVPEVRGAREHLADLRRPALSSLCLALGFIAWVWIFVVGVWLGDPAPGAALLPPVVLLLTCAICLAPVGLPLTLRSAALLVGLSLAFLLGHRWSPAPIWLCYMSLTVIMAGLLWGRGQALGAAAAVSAGWTLLWLQAGQPYDLFTALPALGLVWGAAAVAWLSTNSLYTALDWAMSSQGQAWEAAQDARLRRGELRRALDSLRTTHDILQHTAYDLKRAHDEADQARQSKSLFLANISHELRTPLNVVLGFAEILAFSPERYGDMVWPTELREHILAVWRNADHLLGMVDDVLDLAQIEVRRMPIAKEPGNLERTIRDSLVTVDALLQNSGITLELDIQQDLPSVVFDPTRIRQVILNLVNNAIRYAPGGRIEVSARQVGAEVVVQVHDTGKGIPSERLEIIFQEYEQVDAAADANRQGFGLGLAICRHFVAMHGGHIWVESVVGEGSTFSFTLPLEPDTVHAGPGLGLRATPSRSASQPSRTMMVVGDDRLALRMIERHLSGYRVEGYPTLDEAMAVAPRLLPDAAMVLMAAGKESAADATACDLASGLGETNTPVIVAHLPTEAQARHLLDVEGLLIKPVAAQQLLDAVAEQCAVPGTVLVVDDDPDMVAYESSVLRGRWPQARVIEAYSGQEALSLVGARPDVILLDLRMPEMDGEQLIAALGEKPETARIPIIVVTARGPAERGDHTGPARVHILRDRAYTARELLQMVTAISEVLPKGPAAALPDERDTA